MAVSIKDAHDFIRSIIQKNKAGFVSPKDIDRSINRSVGDWISAVIFRFRKTKKFEYDHLLVKRKEFAVTASTGVQNIPQDLGDFIEALAVYAKDTSGINYEGSIYSYDEFFERVNSSILIPELKFPCATIFIDSAGDSKIQVAPVPTGGATFTYTLVYIKKPVDAEYKYTIDANGNIVHVTSGSKDIQVSDRYYGDILSRALMYLGVALDEQTLLGVEGLKDANQKNDER
jgi:hypothetical protein